jgi:hypothetical protein
LSLYDGNLASGNLRDMVNFNQFVASLGEQAKKYSEDELHRLYGEVLKFADLLLVVRRQRPTATRPGRALSTGHAVDESRRNRTVKTTGSS